MHGEDIVKKDNQHLSGFKEDFCLKTVIWYFLNRLDRLYVVNSHSYKAVGFSDGVISTFSGGHYEIIQGKRLIAENDDMFIPALWINSSSIIAYSKNGYEIRTWKMPENWKGVASVKLFSVSDLGIKELGVIKTTGGNLTLSLKKDDMILIELNN
jgi:hypothetical protein